MAVVALAVWGMAKNLAPDKQRATIAVISGIALLFWEHPVANIVVIAELRDWSAGVFCVTRPNKSILRYKRYQSDVGSP